jgi:hypothetical protein
MAIVGRASVASYRFKVDERRKREAENGEDWFVGEGLAGGKCAEKEERGEG